ncbi:hypothetical protein HYALB_00013449 [Hymenoscyphus albidus]|uniref:Uncharacterized protein n=1 Tax=Hymenoscyphus albidus TaxID=595503 RepID=A0A9N9LXI3_9HELO|nr:hypothetical protein HYALB_00013449 [Hymenoscyphus albidus]
MPSSQAPQLPLTLRLSTSFPSHLNQAPSNSNTALQNRLCDPMIVFHTCGHISEFSCTVGRSFQAEEEPHRCTFNVPPVEDLEGICGLCIERGDCSSPVASCSSSSSTFNVGNEEDKEAYEEDQGIGDMYIYNAEALTRKPSERLCLRLRGLRLKIRGWIYRVARVEVGEFELQPHGIGEKYR